MLYIVHCSSPHLPTLPLPLKDFLPLFIPYSLPVESHSIASNFQSSLHCDSFLYKNCFHYGKVSVPALQPYPEVLRDLLEGNDQESTSFRKTSGITTVHSPLRLLESNCAFLLEEVSIASASKARLIRQRHICTLVMVNRNMGNCTYIMEENLATFSVTGILRVKETDTDKKRKRRGRTLTKNIVCQKVLD
ncbi:hypothetical protein FHG87_023426 [Trinorchestia longiramus]|nr:hypothetical protein FHG87_023426 [Trinorchestia longiramus]